MINKVVFIFSIICFQLPAADRIPAVYEFTTFCPQSRQACGVILDQKPPSTDDSPEYTATIWKGNLSNAKTILISETKFRHIDRTFHNMHLWQEMKEGAYVVEKLPTDERMLFFNVKSSKGQHHLVISRYSNNLGPLEKVMLNWEAFLKGQVMQINSQAFKQGF